MLVLVVILSLLFIIGSIWFMGLWSNVLTLVNIFISAMVASSGFETTANFIENMDPTYTYIADFLGAWLLFFLSFGFFRLLADALSRFKLKFDPIVDYIGRTFVAIAAAWIFVCFACFTLHMAPASPELFAGGPADQQLVVGPDRLWLRFMHSRSKGALADVKKTLFFPEYDLPEHPDDRKLGVRVFDPFGDFVYKYRHRRQLWSQEDQLRVFREPL